MEKRIALECGNLEKSEVTTLNLDHCKSNCLSGLTEEFTTLETLSLINCGLTTLDGFPALTKLRKLELADNFLSGGFQSLVHCQSLQKINLSGNKIKDIESLRPLSKLANLTALDLFSNEVTSCDSFPDNVREILPNVQSFCEDELEGLSSSGDEDEDGQENEDDYENEDDASDPDADELEPLDSDYKDIQARFMGGKSGPSGASASLSAANGPSNPLEGDLSDDEDEGDDDEDQSEDGEGEPEGEGEAEGDIEGVSDEEEDEDEEDGEFDDEDDEEEGPGLEYLYGNNLNEDEDEDGEFQPGNDSEDGPTPAKQAKTYVESVNNCAIDGDGDSPRTNSHLEDGDADGDDVQNGN